jgi:peptide/nickel transport system substrate-binding protein
VRFHPSSAFPVAATRTVVAEDVRYSFERIRDPRTASPGRWVFDGVLDGPQGFEVRDDSTFTIHLKRPFPPFLGMLTMVYASVVPQEAVLAAGAGWRSSPVGAGPFRLFHWEEGVKLVLHKAPEYYQRDGEGVRLPYLEAVSVSFVKDRNAEFLALVKGELDMMSGADGSFLGELLDPLGRVRDRYADRVQAVRAPSLATDYLGFMVGEGSASVAALPWSDVRVRRAVDRAIDRDRIVTHLLHGVGTPATGLLPPGMPGKWSHAQAHDPEAARALLAEAGYPGGKGLPPLTLTATASYLELCESVQYDLAQVGIRVKVDVVPLSTHKEATAHGDLQFFRKNWIADYPDAENFLMLFTTANHSPAGPNYTRYSNPAMDAWYDEALRTADQERRFTLYSRMDSVLVADVPAIFLLHPEVIRFARAEVEGLSVDPMNQLDLRRVRKVRAVE